MGGSSDGVAHESAFGELAEGGVLSGRIRFPDILGEALAFDAGVDRQAGQGAQIHQYQGIKSTKDVDDAYWLAEMARLDILPTGYLYEPELRSVRDLLRRRMLLVHQRTSLILSFKGLHIRTHGTALPLAKVKGLEAEQAAALFEREGDQLAAQAQLALIGNFDEQIAKIETAVLKQVKQQPLFQRLQSLPGVGKILGMTIALEVGDIERFASPGNLASYCRTVESKRLSNDKVKGRNNGKCGNKYLAWAFVEAAHGAKRYNDRCAEFFEKKKKQRNTSVATKALACKMAKAAWWIMREGTKYDSKRMFGG
jgi:transposase